jgi:hypothetical protein
MELALKAYLIQCGVSEKDLKDEGGHDLKNLVDEAVNRGLSLPAGSKEMIPRWLVQVYLDLVKVYRVEAVMTYVLCPMDQTTRTCSGEPPKWSTKFCRSPVTF